MIRCWIEKKLGLPSPMPPSVRTGGALRFLIQKGLGPYLRGLLKRPCFKSCGRSFFLGKNTAIYFADHVQIGDRVFIGSNCTIQALSRGGVKLGDHVRIRDFTWILCSSELHRPGEGLEIGSHTYIGPFCYLGAGGGLSIGKNVLVGGYVQFLAENHEFGDVSRPIQEQGVSRKGIKVGDNVWIGNQAILVDGIEIGEGSVIGAGSVVTHDVPPHTVVAGNPARVLRKRE